MVMNVKPSSALDGKSRRISVPEIARRLAVSRIAVYRMLAQGVIPAIRLRKRWIVTRHAYDQWERTAGMRLGAGLCGDAEVRLVA